MKTTLYMVPGVLTSFICLALSKTALASRSCSVSVSNVAVAPPSDGPSLSYNKKYCISLFLAITCQSFFASTCTMCIRKEMSFGDKTI